MRAKENPHQGGSESFSGRQFTTPPTEPPDFEQAARFLTLLDETAKSWTFQTFDDWKARNDKSLARVLHGTLEQHWQELCELSSCGDGIFITVQETNGKGRKVADIIQVRAVFQECDRPGTPEPPLQPHIVVESSPGKYHRYFLVGGGHRFDLFEQVMARLVQDFGSDPNAKDRARVLRLPGFPHQKDPATPWIVRIIHESGEQPYSWDKVTAAIPPLLIEKKAADVPPGKGIGDPMKVRSALHALNPDMEYAAWLSVGMALHHATAGGAEGLALWDEWSASGRSYRPGETPYKWASFGNVNGRPVTLASVFKMAVAAGWWWKDPSKGDATDTEPPDPAATARNDTDGTIKDENLFSDYGNVVKLIEHLRDRIAYTPGLDWLLYNPASGIWEPEPGSERVKRIVMETLRDAWNSILYAAQQDEADLKKQLKELDGDNPKAAMLAKQVKLASVHRDKVFAWVRQCETAYRIRSTLEIAEGYFWTRPEVWDANPNILVCNNGVLDLATGTLLPHAPGYRATKTTGTDYCSDATHPAWDAVVALLKAEGDRYKFIHHYCGSGMHGCNPCEKVVIFQGDGGTGKGTLLTAIHQALGAYAETVEVGSLLATDWRKQNKSAPREDLLKLRGARFVFPSIEPPKDSKLDDGSIKALTGNDAITARYPYSKHSITFTPVFKLVIQTNFPLQTEFDDPGMKRRVIVVPFNQKPERPDPAIKDALMHDSSARAATLAWLYEGYRAWRNAGFALPESDLATKATAEYWTDMDPYAQFARDVGLCFGRGLKCLKPRMTGAFKAWRDETGRRDATAKGFPKWLKSMGCYDAQTATYERYWHGVDFMESSSQPQQPPQPPISGNETVDFEYSESTEQFPETAGCCSCSSCGDTQPTADDCDLQDFDEALGG